MKLVVGLGNPGKQYEKTRHNVGFMVVDQFVKDFSESKRKAWSFSEKFKSDILEFEWQRRSSLRSSGQASFEKIVLTKPRTYMNNSGLAVELLTSYFRLPTSDVWVVHDDIDLPLCSLKIRFGGGTAGHRGIESIIKGLNTDKFWRFRIGIGSKNQISNLKSQKSKEIDSYVLGRFSAHERGKMREIMRIGSEAIQLAIEEGMEKAMNRYNIK